MAHRLLAELSPAAFRAALPELLEIYVEAMSYPLGTAQTRTPLWADHSRREGFRCVVALDADTIVGLGYGYTGKPGQWWHREVARGLAHHPDTALPGAIDDYFELTELHVSPRHQGVGLGESLLRALVMPVTSRHVLLSTPEGENRAWKLYRRLGFVDVVRRFLFTGDPRPFAVLGRTLPFDTLPIETLPIDTLPSNTEPINTEPINTEPSSTS